MKQSLSLLAACLLIGSAATLLLSCDPSQANAQHELEGLLNSPEGQTMTADELVGKSHNSAWDKARGAGMVIDVPLTKADTRPLTGGVYVANDTGSSMSFSLTDSIDSINTVGHINIVWHEDQWGNPRPEKTFNDTVFLQSRGKGLYAIYRYKRVYDDMGEVVTDSLGHPLTKRFWEGILLYVYPGADSIYTTRGSELTNHTYYYQASQ